MQRSTGIINACPCVCMCCIPVGSHNDHCCFGLQALPSEDAVQWREQEELQDLYSVYIGKDKDTAKQQVLQKLFKLSDSDAQSLRDVVESGQFRVDAEDDDSSFF